MIDAQNRPWPDNEWKVPFDGSFQVAHAPTKAANAPDQKALKKALSKNVDKLSDLQRVLYANGHHALLLVFQAMDAGGKDSTIRHVLSGVNPAGCRVVSFKQPSAEELDHDFLWRSTMRLPKRGKIGVFNRSYYEEVLVVRVHQELLASQGLAHTQDMDAFWAQRYASINDHERHLVRNGTVVLKFWLNVSKEEQKARFLARLREPEKYWKFSSGDIDERALWPKYMEAYQTALNATSTPHAPWYAIPADDKPYMRWQVSEIIRNTLESLELAYPKVDEKEQKRFAGYEQRLQAEDK